MMPWRTQDVESHIKSLTDKQKEAWVKVANKALSSCLADGGSREDCEGSAIRQANTVAKKVEESMDLEEIGKTISAATESKIKAAISALQELLGLTEADRRRLLLEAAELSFGERERQVRDAIRSMVGGDQQTWIYLCDMYDNYCVYTVESNAPAGQYKDYRVSYTLKNAEVALGLPEEVRRVISYEPILEKESESSEVAVISEDGEKMALAEEYIDLIEKAIEDDGLAHIRLIAPGWGSSGYYSPELLQRDGPKVFHEGLHMHLDHQTAAEAKARPEGSTKDLAGVLASDAHWEENGPVGPGLYADAKVFEPYRPLVNEMAPHIGVSIRANGKAVYGEAEGRKGHIIEAITKADTTDYVTHAGAGGQILSLAESGANEGIEIRLFEAARDRLQNQEVETMNEDELKALQEAKDAAETKAEMAEAENARLKESLLLREAQDVVADALAKTDMPELTRTRLADGLGKNPPVKEGKLDAEALGTRIQEVVQAEMEYIAQISGTGKVRGMGSPTKQEATADLKESFANMYLRQGKTTEEAEKLATLASAGR